MNIDKLKLKIQNNEEVTEKDLEGITNSDKKLMTSEEIINHRFNKNKTLLHIAAKYSDLQTIACLHKLGANLDAQDDNGNTPLHIAAVNGSLPVIELLFKLGANPDAKENNGNTPLHFASSFCNSQAIKLLIEKGANPNAQDNNNNTPLHFAAKTNYLTVLELLMTRGLINFAVQNNNDDYPWNFINSFCKLQTIELLINLGANPNAQDNNGNTPLHLVIINSYSQDENGDSTLNIAARNYHLIDAKVLVVLGADPTIPNKNGKTPIDLIKENSRTQSQTIESNKP